MGGVVAYSFKQRFVEPILAGTKGGTIRAERKTGGPMRALLYGGHAHPGRELQLYTGMRTRQCRLIARKQCVDVEPIKLLFARGQIRLGKISETSPRAVLQMAPSLDAFARFDGFHCWDALRSFWREEHGDHPEFVGWHIRWLPLPEWK